ncbi:MAG: cytochrome c biogenesis protein CcsA [Phycisphaerae bacterium]|nr:cytochrome c biogenesis protein CcsA [Phycisphaerae bacterium]
MLRRLICTVLWSLTLAPSLWAAAPADAPAGLDRLGALPLQDGGRVMPLETYARRLAVEITGRTRWSSNGPESFTGRAPMELLLDVMFKGREMLTSRVVTIDDKPLKRSIGLDPERRFFSPAELATTPGLNELLMSFERARAQDPQAKPDRTQRKALDIRAAANRIADLAGGEPLAVVPSPDGAAFRRAGPQVADPGAEKVQEAWKALGEAYIAGRTIEPEVDQLERAIASLGVLTPIESRAVALEVFYVHHDPWTKTAVFYGLAIVAFGLSRLMLQRPLNIVAMICTGLGVAEHVMGVGLRIIILNRAPVSNTFEALLWMGLVAIALGLVAQLLNRRKGWYAFAGVCAAFVSVLFAGLVPLTDGTNSLPAVLRSNFWLTVHVLTIVASYGVLTVSAVLGHAYLIKNVLLRSRENHSALVVQTYRTIQVGLFLLTAGTILGGVWAAESWGRFWGWDPKETWALISILVYFAVLHARYVGWLKDFGLAAAAVLGLVVIVWTFYGVNYVMASGLHSYGFGSGGESWVALWAVAEFGFIALCWLRRRPQESPAGPSRVPAPSPRAS